MNELLWVHVQATMAFSSILHVLILFSFVSISLAASGAPPATSSIASRQAPKNYEIVAEKEVYSRWRTVIQRQVRYPNGNIVDFDVSRSVLRVMAVAWLSILTFISHSHVTNFARTNDRFKTKREPAQ